MHNWKDLRSISDVELMDRFCRVRGLREIKTLRVSPGAQHLTPQMNGATATRGVA